MGALREEWSGNGVKGFWRDYEHETDYEAVLVLHAKLEDKVGRQLDIPNLSLRPTLVAMVYEQPDGSISKVIYAEAEMEIGAAGDGALTPEDLAAVAERFDEVGRYYNIHIQRAFVPRSVLTKPNGKPTAIKRLLGGMGFTEETGPISQFYRWIQPGDERNSNVIRTSDERNSNVGTSHERNGKVA